MSAHTPGPWTAKTYSTETVRDAVGIYAGTLQVVPDIAGRSIEQCDANIRLIAAAPDLLQALLIIDANAAESVDWIRRVAREAIEKATGGAA